MSDLTAPAPLRWTAESLQVCAAIWELGEATLTQIARRTDVATGTASPILSRLAAAGVLNRRQEIGDPRELARPLRTFYRIVDVEVIRPHAKRLIAACSALVAE